MGDENINQVFYKLYILPGTLHNAQAFPEIWNNDWPRTEGIVKIKG